MCCNVLQFMYLEPYLGRGAMIITRVLCDNHIPNILRDFIATLF